MEENKINAISEPAAMEENKINVISEPAAEVKTNIGTYTHFFKKPFDYMGKEIDEITFDFEKMTGGDSLKIENELRLKNHLVATKTFDAEYKVRFAARCSTPAIGYDALGLMPFCDYEAIMKRVQTFLMSVG